MYKLHHTRPGRPRLSKQDRRLPQDIKICGAVPGLQVDQLLVRHCRHPTTLLFMILYFHSANHGYVISGDLCSGDWPACSSSRRDGYDHSHAMEGSMTVQSPDVVIHVVCCILDKFVGHVWYVRSLGAGRISLKEVYFFVWTAKALVSL